MVVKKQKDIRCPSCNSLLMRMDHGTVLAGAVETICRKCKESVRVEPDVRVVLVSLESNGVTPK